MIGTARVGGDLNVVVNAPTIDFHAFVRSAGWLSPADAADLRERVERSEADLKALGQGSDASRKSVDEIANAINLAHRNEAEAAFDDLFASIDQEANALRLNKARALHAKATLLYPFQASASLPLLEQAAKTARTTFVYWVAFGRAAEETGDLAKALAAFEAARALVRSDPDRGREYAIALDDIGDVQLEMGNLAAALAAYEHGLDIRTGLANDDPLLQGGSADVGASYLRIGDVQMARGERSAALKSYEQSYDIAFQHSQKDLGNVGRVRDMSAGLQRIGNVHWAEGAHEKAQNAFQSSLELNLLVAEAAPENAQFASDVASSYTKLGGVRAHAGDLEGALADFGESLTISRNLTARDEHNTEWSRSLAVVLDNIGDIHLASGNLDVAYSAFDESLRISRRLVERDRGNAAWALDLSISLSKIGDVEHDRGNGDAARSAYDESLCIVRGLSTRDPENASWARDVWIALWRLASLDAANAADLWREIVDRMETMQRAGTLQPHDLPSLEQARAFLAGSGRSPKG